jgi:UDP-N-acetylglucosamine 2-epimerase (non-hydrolysing)
VQGDTTTVMTAALAAFYQKIPVAHVEAGLRTGDMHNPFPEEMNRVLTSRLARWHFAPTQQAAIHLRQEGIAEATIYVTGNTVIDALLQVAASTQQIESLKPTILVTTHRRENFGQPLLNICQAILQLAERFGGDYDVVVPVHPNPNVRDVIYAQLGQHDAIRLIAPLEYRQFVTAMQQATLILTDSGGVQEEAPALGKPVLVLREETERPEAIEAGVVKLVGTEIDTIVSEATRLLTDHAYYQSMARGISPYGDGLATQRIVDVLVQGN